MKQETKEKELNYTAAAWILAALIAASIEPIIVRMGYRGTVTPYQLLVIKTTVAAILIFPLTRKFRWIGWKGILKIGSVSILLLFNNMCSLIALKNVSAVIYLTLITTNPAIIALLNSYRGRDRLSFKFWAGFILCFAGVLLTLNIQNMDSSKATMIGILFILFAMTCTIIYRTRMEDVTEEFTPVLVSTYIFWINALLVLIFVAPFIDPIPAAGWKIGIWIGFAGAVANVAFLSALHILGATRVSIFNMLQRPLVIICAAVILKEYLSIWQISGIIMVIAGVNISKVKRLKKRPPIALSTKGI